MSRQRLRGSSADWTSYGIAPHTWTWTVVLAVSIFAVGLLLVFLPASFRWWLCGKPSPWEFGYLDDEFVGVLKQDYVRGLIAQGHAKERPDSELRVNWFYYHVWLRIVFYTRGRHELAGSEGWYWGFDEFGDEAWTQDYRRTVAGVVGFPNPHAPPDVPADESDSP